MANSLLQRVENVRQLARQVVWVHALGWFLALLVGSFLALATLDYLTRPIDLGTRWLLTLAFLAAAVAGVWRWLWNAWLFRPSLLETAQRIEQRYGELSGGLAGSVEFSQAAEADPAAGSVALRRRVISATEATIERIDLRQAINIRPQVRALTAAIGSLVLIAAWGLFDARTLGVAAGRLAIPWSTYAWPRRNHLEFVEAPQRLARGQNWEVGLTDTSGHPPEQVTLAIRYEQGETARHTMKFLAGHLVHRLENITRPFEYRAYGGDDDTLPWQRLEVVEPLRLLDITVRVQSPEYAGPAWEATGMVFTLLANSRLSVRGSVDRPLQSATLHREGSEEQTTLEISADGYSFHSFANGNQAWQPRENGAYLLELHDLDGVLSSAAYRWEVRVAADNAPTLTVDQPLDGWQVTPQAVLPVQGTAKDDLALKSIALRFARSTVTDQPPDTLSIWKAKRNPLLGAKQTGTTGGDVQPFEAVWDLQQAAPFQPGDVLSWYLEAEDFSPQAGRSTAAKLSIVSAAELQERLTLRQLSALAQLSEALKLQRETRGQIGGLEVQWNELKSWRPRDRDLLHGAELHQRQVQSLTGRSPTGAGTILAGILREIEMNRLELPDLAAKCGELLSTLDQLDRERYPLVGNQFALLLREIRHEGEVAAAIRQELVKLGREQETVIQILEGLLGNLSEWDNFQRLRRDLTQLRKAQQELATLAIKLQAEMLATGKATPQHTADAKQLARQQSELARQFDKWQARLAQYAERSAEEKETSRTAAAALEAANQLAIAAKMRGAAEAIGESKLGPGVERQQAVEVALAALLDEFAGRKREDSEQQLQQLRDTARRIGELLHEQKPLADDFEKQKKQPTPELQRLEDRQRALAQRAEEVAKQLQRNQPNSPASKSTQEAAQAMQQAAAAAQQKAASPAAEQARAAEQKLAAAKQAVQEEIQRREADLLRERMVKLEQHIQGLIVRQESLEKETLPIRQLQMQQQEVLTAAQAATCSDLQAEQEALRAETGELGRSPQMPAAFAWQLEQTAHDMQAAAEQLRSRKMAESLGNQQAALARLRIIKLALQQDAGKPADPNEKPPGDQPPSPPPPNDTEPPDIHDLAEVKLLRAMQAEINRRTLEIESKRGIAGALPPELVPQLASLASEQGRLVELTLRMVRKLSQKKTENKAEVPGVSDEDLLKKLDEALLPEAPPKTEK